MIGFIIGFVCGAIFGVGIMAVCSAASYSDPSDLEEQAKFIEDYMKRKR